MLKDVRIEIIYCSMHSVIERSDEANLSVALNISEKSVRKGVKRLR